jgi:hypothetical protein
MEYSREDFETLRLLRAFSKIQDPQKRREIIELLENKAAAPKENPDDEQPKPSHRPAIWLRGQACVSCQHDANRTTHLRHRPAPSTVRPWPGSTPGRTRLRPRQL